MPVWPRAARHLVLLFVLLSVILPGALAADAVEGKLRPDLRQALESAGEMELVPVSIVLSDQLTGQRLRRAVPVLLEGDDRRRAVTAALKTHAAASQGALLAALEEAARTGRADRIRPLWIGNIVGADLTPDWIRRIAARPEVAWINHDPKVDVFLERPAAGDATAGGGGTDAVECGTDLMQAPRVWNELGFTGEGAVIAVIDTGVCWSHPDIANQIWVNPGEDLDGDRVVMDADDVNGVDDDGNGFIDDFIGWDFDIGDNDPNDDSNGHGSHVAGTVAGDGTQGTQAGMAPDAQIMVLRVGVSFADEVDVWNAMQYAADNGADSISMSLGWPHNQNPDRTTWRQNCENTIDAGTAMVIAAGNEGQGNEPDNVRTPGDVPRIISVGAVDCNDNAASFTSRGPVTWQDISPWFDHPYPPGLIKPDVSAPGVGTQSHNFCSGYTSKSGTSMATPHTAGAVALMLSSNPGLVHDDIKEILELSSIDLGPAGKDNTFGTGRVDAYEAVLLSGTSDGLVRLGDAEYSCADTMTLTVSDKDLAGSGTITVDVTSSTETSAEVVTLTETSATSGVFRGTLATAAGPAAADGVLQVSGGDVIDALYIDADDGEGGLNVPKTDTATADCAAPFFADIRAEDIDDTSATIRWATDEPATSLVRYGLSTPPTDTRTSPGLTADHAVTLTGLPECTIVFFEVESTDSLGNAGGDSNGGAYYRFETYGNFPDLGVIPCHAGQVQVDAEVYSCADIVTVTVTDIDLNQDVNAAESVSVTLTSTTESDPETLLLTETGPNTSQFTGSIGTAGGAALADGVLQTTDGDTITATYRDDDAGGGSTAITASSGVADCAGPAITDLHVEQITQNRVEVVWTTSEPASSRVDHGPTSGLGQAVTDGALTTSHRLAVSPYDTCGVGYFKVQSSDVFGNTTAVLRSGTPHQFSTAFIPGLFWNDGFETDKGWTLTGEWERGAPAGLGGSVGNPDPAAAFAATNVIGVDLSGQGSFAGDYEPGGGGSAISPMLDASGLTDGTLLIRRKLSVEGNAADSATIGALNGFWSNVWTNPTSTINDADYTLQSYDISALADGNPALAVSFGLNADATNNYAGWTLDEVIIKDGSLPNFQQCADCSGAPSFAGVATAVDIDACASGGVRVSWPMAAAWGTGSGGTYALYRDTTSGFVPGPGNLVADGIAGTSYDDASAPEGVDLYYLVRAESDEACGAGSNNGGVVDGNLVEGHGRNDVSQPLPSDISQLMVGGVDDVHVRLSWPSTAGAASYRVYRSENPQMSGQALLGEGGGLQHDDPHAMLDAKSYYYVVAPANTCGQEP